MSNTIAAAMRIATTRPAITRRFWTRFCIASTSHGRKQSLHLLRRLRAPILPRPVAPVIVVKWPAVFLLGDRASDQQPLDLASAFVDGEDLGVAVVLLDRMV